MEKTKVTKVTQLAPQKVVSQIDKKDPQKVKKVANLTIHFLAQKTDNGEIKDVCLETPVQCYEINGCIVFKFEKLNSEYYEVLNDADANAFLIKNDYMLGYWQHERGFTKQDDLGRTTTNIFRTRYVLTGYVPNDIAQILHDNHPSHSTDEDMPF